ncbi:MAG: TolB family protein [Candidatus Aminicenantes bacterium]|nr:TolB family protein [Candidatus Aminicenantes bacterium]
MAIILRPLFLKRCLALLVLAYAAALFCCSPGDGESAGPQAPPPELSSLRPQFEFRGRIFFQSDMDGDSEIFVLTAQGVTKLTDNSWQDEYPRVSPDGRRIAFSANPSGTFQIYTMSTDGTDIVQVTRAPHDAIEHAWHPDGRRIAYTVEAPGRNFSIWTFDLETKRAEKLLPQFRGSNALPDFSPAAPLVTFTGKRLMGWDVYMLDLSAGRFTDLVKGGRSCRGRFSPDGKKVVYVSSEADGKGDIWIMNPDGTDKKRLTERDDMYDYFPSWSPDGKYVVFCSDKRGSLDGGRWALFLVKVETKRVFPLFDSGRRDLFPEWH